MAGIRGWSELRGYSSSEWKADIGFLVREFEIQQEKEKSVSSNGVNESSTKHQLTNWIFGRRHLPRH
jgi:hypothetical protein